MAKLDKACAYGAQDWRFESSQGRFQLFFFSFFLHFFESKVVEVVPCHICCARDTRRTRDIYCKGMIM